MRTQHHHVGNLKALRQQWQQPQICSQDIDAKGGIVDVNNREKSLLQTLRNPRRNGG